MHQHRRPAPARTPPRARIIDGERIETTNRRTDVAGLHAAEPWLSPDEASARLQMPISNLRIFTQELGIAWTQQRTAAPPIVADAPPTKLMRVRVVHEQHPTWTARMIANHLGEKETSVATYLATVRREANPISEVPAEFASRAALSTHYDEVSKRLGKV